jgi:hypothetical protein
VLLVVLGSICVSLRSSWFTRPINASTAFSRLVFLSWIALFSSLLLWFSWCVRANDCFRSWCYAVIFFSSSA